MKRIIRDNINSTYTLHDMNVFSFEVTDNDIVMSIWLRRKEVQMATFYFVRHWQMDITMAGKKFYKDFSYNMMTLSEKGITQIKVLTYW